MEVQTERMILDAVDNARAQGATWNEIIDALQSALIRAQMAGVAD